MVSVMLDVWLLSQLQAIQRRRVGYRRRGGLHYFAAPKVVRCPCPLTILMLATKLFIS